MAALDRLWQELEARHGSGGRGEGWLRRLFSRQSTADEIAGLYLWGGVGRGKTYLMDMFYESLSLPRKQRTHFHRFMQGVHERLKQQQGQKNPLDAVAADIASEAEVICFDEFFVLDIGDAMILAGLLRVLFQRGVVLVATSNVPPTELYRNGLQRERFLPAIALLEAHCRVLEIGEGVDYRLRSLERTTLYLSPIDADTEAALLANFNALAPDHQDRRENLGLRILGREIEMRLCAGDVAWFDFAALCEGPRSAFDYVEIAREFHALILSDVPPLRDDRREQVRRFIHLVDELYDRRVKLILSAEVGLDRLYEGEALAFEFERTRSRLMEMQSQDYLASAHRG